MNTIILKLLTQEGADVSTLTEKQEALQKCDVLMRSITEVMFTAIHHKYAASRD